MSNGIITLLTDFGLSDPFVGVLHGVIANRFPEAKVIDLSHGIPAQDVRAAGYWLARSYRWFPDGTTHVAVVDPGVGTERKILAATLHGHQFVLPDNGLLPNEWQREPDLQIVEVHAEALGLRPMSATFHARDLFVPIACELAAGRVRLRDLGPELSRPAAILDAPASSAEGQVVVVDRFGNLITDLRLTTSPHAAHVLVADQRVPIGATYASVPAGDLVALTNAFGSLEIACRNGSAAARLGCGVGSRVTLLTQGLDPD